MDQLFLNCLDRATEPSIAIVSLREQPMHFNDNQTLNLRVVDPFEDDGVWAIDEGCNSCCHGEVWRQKAEMKMKVLGLDPIWRHRKATIFQWFWNEYDHWQVQNPHGHTIAGIRHGDTKMRAFT